MHNLFATQRIFHVMGTNPGAESANFPSYSAALTRLLTFQWNAAAGLGSDSIVGQSNVLGTHPPR